MYNDTIVITNDHKIPIIARRITKGDKYGRNGCLTHAEEEDVVEFYDSRYNHNPELGLVGQFISRYYVSTLITSPNWTLCLCGGIPDWDLNENNLTTVVAWLKEAKS